MKRFKWDTKYLYWGVTALCVICLSLVFYFCIDRIGAIGGFFSKIMRILSPFVWGLAIAYILNPVLQIYQRYLFTPLFGRILKNSTKKDSLIKKWSRGTSLLFAVLTLLFLVVAMFWLILPQLYTSIYSIVASSGTYANNVTSWIERFLSGYPEIEDKITQYFGDLTEFIINWAETVLLPQMGSIVASVTTGAYYVIKVFYNFFIGIIVSVYVLYNKETFAAYCKKITYCIFSVPVSQKILGAFRFTDSVFKGFLSGKIFDSLIIGILCYIGCVIMRMPYSPLVSVIIGVTNVIPFFGPFIGAIPCTLIILMISPVKALIFVIFIIALQQFDGNFLGPKILGNSVGINGFWVLFAILVGGGLYGVGGMLLGVPVFVVIYAGIKNVVEKKLKRSGLPTETEKYKEIDHIDPVSNEAVNLDHEQKKSSIRKNRKIARTKAKKGGAPAGEESTDENADNDEKE